MAKMAPSSWQDGETQGTADPDTLYPSRAPIRNSIPGEVPELFCL